MKRIQLDRAAWATGLVHLGDAGVWAVSPCRRERISGYSWSWSRVDLGHPSVVRPRRESVRAPAGPGEFEVGHPSFSIRGMEPSKFVASVAAGNTDVSDAINLAHLQLRPGPAARGVVAVGLRTGRDSTVCWETIALLSPVWPSRLSRGSRGGTVVALSTSRVNLNEWPDRRESSWRDDALLANRGWLEMLGNELYDIGDHLAVVSGDLSTVAVSYRQNDEPPHVVVLGRDGTMVHGALPGVTDAYDLALSHDGRLLAVTVRVPRDEPLLNLYEPYELGQDRVALSPLHSFSLGGSAIVDEPRVAFAPDGLTVACLSPHVLTTVDLE